MFLEDEQMGPGWQSRPTKNFYVQVFELCWVV